MQKGRIIILFRLVIFVLCSCFSPQLTHTHTHKHAHTCSLTYSLPLPLPHSQRTRNRKTFPFLCDVAHNTSAQLCQCTGLGESFSPRLARRRGCLPIGVVCCYFRVCFLIDRGTFLPLLCFGIFSLFTIGIASHPPKRPTGVSLLH